MNRKLSLAAIICVLAIWVIAQTVMTNVTPSNGNNPVNTSIEQTGDESFDSSEKSLEYIHIPFKLKEYETNPVTWWNNHFK